MGYEDRDYFQSKPKFELSPGVNPATKGLLTVLASLFVGALIVANSMDFASAEFLGGGTSSAGWVARIFVLTSADVAPWASGFSPGHWKLATHWLLSANILTLVFDCLGVFLVGRMVEEMFGTRRYILLLAGACALSGLLAGMLDPLLVPGRTSVILGPGGGLIAMMVSVAWIAPHQRTIMGWQLRPVVLGLAAIFAGLALLQGVFSGGAVTHSPSQMLFGALLGVGYMSFLKSRGRIPTPAPGSFTEAWNRRGNKHEDVDPVARALIENRKAEEKEKAETEKRRAGIDADQKRLDGILDKISREGIAALSRSDRSFLDDQSKKRRV